MLPNDFEGYPLPGHHPTRWAKYYLMKCKDCGLVAPARVAVHNVTHFRCAACDSKVYDESYGENGFNEVPAEIAENWDYNAEILRDEELRAKLGVVREQALKRGEIPTPPQGEQLSLEL